jgi:hypothetical protein
MRRGVVTHGLSKAPIYDVWSGIVGRCLNPKNQAFKDYGGRGITLCDRWRSFDNFYADMGDRPVGMSLDRIDNNLGYEPDNCRWATRLEQNRNRRSVRLIEMDGERLPMSEWAARYGLKAATLARRLKKGWAPEEAIKTPLVRQIPGCPRKASRRAWCATAGLNIEHFDEKAAA